MDKYEFRVSLNEINSLVQERRFEEAAEIADTIDWRKVKSPDTLCRISDIYKICKDYERARDILDLANQRNPHIPNIVYSLCELTIFLYGQTGSQADLAKALGLRQEYESECPDDPKRLILEYKFYKVSPVTLTEKIATLEQLRDEAPSARWEYELASLYHQAGQDDLALAECGSIQRNYSGKFADKAAALAQEINPSEPAAGQDNPEAAEALANESAPVEPAAETPTQAAPAEEPVREAAPAEAAAAEEPAYYSGSVDEAPQAEEPADAPTEPIRTERAPRYEAPVQEEPMQAEPAAEETPASDENLSVGQVYDEWERIRRDIRRRNDEQRAQRIMQDTGPLLQDFDETARHGLIEAIEKDAARARRQVRSGASSILGDDGYDRGDRYTDRYNDDRGYRESRYDDDSRYGARDERDDRYDDRDSYYNDAPRGNRRSYEPLPSQDEYYPEDDASGEQYPEDRYADDQYTDSASSEEQYVETPAPQETYAEESVPEERDNSITSETVHVGPEENDQSSEPRRGSAFAAAVAGAAAGAAAAHLADEAEDVATRRWNSDEIRGALAAAKAGVEATKDVTADGITAAASTAAAVDDKAQDAIATPTAEPAQPVFDAAAERARIEAEVRAQIAAEQEAARQKAEAEAAQKAAAEEAARKAAEAEAARKAAEEQARREAEEAARKAAEQEAARKAAEEKIRKEAEEKARKDAEEEARAQMYAEIEARVRAEYEQKAQAEAAAKAEAEAAQKAAAEEAARKAAEEEAARKAAEAAAIAAAAVAAPEAEEVVEEDVDELAHGEEDGINQISPAEEPDVRDDDNADDEAEAVAHKDVDTADYDNVEPVARGEHDDSIDDVPHAHDTDAHEGDNADEIAERHIPENRPVGAAQSNYDEDAPASAASSIATANDKAPTPEELRLFGPFYRMRENREQVTTALDKISLASYTGNLIITGNAVTARRVAQGLLELTREADSNFTGKIAKATGTALNNLTDEKFHSILSKIENGALIIEHASTMDEAAVRRMYNELEGRDHGVIVVLMDAKKPLDEFLETYKTYVSSFSARVDIRPLNDRALVDYGKDYANSKDYALDEMAELALSSRISGMQSPSHRVTLKEVRDIIDEAITYASRKTPHALMEVLSRKRYDADDRIILHEKDFQHN